MFRPSVLRLRVPDLLIVIIVLMAAVACGAGTLISDVPAAPSGATSRTPAAPRTDRPMLTAHQVAAAEKLAELAMHHHALVKGAYRQIAQMVVKDFDGADLGLQSPPLILRQWSLLDAWVIRQAAEQRAGGGYPELLSKLDPSLQVLTLDLGADTTLLAVNASGIGHIVIVQKGLPVPLWRVDRVPESGLAAEQLGCWRPEAGTRPCAPWRAGLLPADAQGRLRFYIDAEHAQVSAKPRVHQLSLWRWDGRSATPLYVTFYGAGSGAQEEGARIEGDLITIERTDHLHMLNCAACSGRKLAQRLQLTPADEVKELPEAPAGDPASMAAEL